MDLDRRNPYLILGLPYGATADDARKAFARRVRTVRRSDSSLFSVQDLTWALHEIEHGTENAEAALNFFRVPANRATLAIPRLGELFAPDAVPRPRRSPPVDDGELAALARDAARHAAVKALTRMTRLEFPDPYT